MGNNLNDVIKKINSQYKQELVQLGTGMIYVDKIPFSSPRANYMTYGGIPLGKATEFIGAESGGKTTSALDITAQAQKKAKREYDEARIKLLKRLEELNKSESKQAQKDAKKVQEQLDEFEANGVRKVVYVDAENTLDEDWARKIGVDTENLILIKPQEQTAEQVLQMMLDIIASGEVILIVLDSLPMLVSQKLFDENLDKKAYGGIADAVTTFCNKVTGLIAKHRTALLIINQVREDFVNPYNQFKTPGGRALKHLYALRLFFRKGSFIDKDNKELANKNAQEPVGNLVEITIVKTKVCKPDRRVGFYTLNYTSSIDYLSDTVDLLIKYDIIAQTGSWFNILTPDGEIVQDALGNDCKFQGKAKLLEYLREDEVLFDELYEALHELIK